MEQIETLTGCQMGAPSRFVRKPPGLDTVPRSVAAGHHYGCSRNKLHSRT